MTDRIVRLLAPLTVVAALLPTLAIGADELPPPPSLPERISPLEGWIPPDGFEPLKPLKPLRPAGPEEMRRREAASWYMTGQLLISRGENAEALVALRKAIDADPAAIAPYSAALPLLLNAGRNEEAEELVLSAARHTEEGFELVQSMAAVLARQSDLAGSISLVRVALKLSTLEAGSEIELMLHRDLGLYFRLDGKFKEAAEHYKMVFDAVRTGGLDDAAIKRLLRDAGATLDEFGDVFLKSSQPELALAAYEEASKYREAKPGLHSFNLASVFKETGQPEKALEELQKYFDAQLQSRGRAAYELLAELLKELDRHDELIPRLQALHKADEHNEVLRYYLADAYLDAGRLDEAEKLYRGETGDVRDPRALVGLLGLERKRGNVAGLLAVLTKTLQTVPRANDDAVLQRLAPDVRDLSLRFERELTSLKEDDGLLTELLDEVRRRRAKEDPKLEFIEVYALGKLALEADRSDDALDFYRFAISMRNDPPALLYTEPALHLIDSQRYQPAADLLREALEHPSDGLQQERWRFLFFLSYAEEFLGNTDAALDAIREARHYQPDMARLAFQEAWVHYHARHWDEALDSFNRVIADYPADRQLAADCRFRISNIYVEKGDREKGEQVLLELLKDDPENTQANNDLGYLWADAGKNLERAREMIAKAVAAEPDNPAYLDSMGWVLFRLGQFEQAATYLEKATQQEHGEDSTIFDHLGDCYEKLGRSQQAQATWKKALKIEEDKPNPDRELVEKIRKKIAGE